MAFPFLDKVTQMLRQALADHLAPGGHDCLDLFSDDAVFEFPFSPGGGIHVEGKQKMIAYLHKIEDGVAFDEFTLKASYPGADGQTMVLEYDSKGRNQESGLPYAQSYIAVVRLSDGRITLLREYLNPLAVQAAESAQV